MLRQSDRNDYLPLCFRCHHRARFLESGGVEEARYECGQIEHAVVGCYMFRPCRPFALRPEQGDKRPVGAAWTLSARVNAVAEAPGEWVLTKGRLGFVILWKGSDNA
jgi:hypothetical protein